MPSRDYRYWEPDEDALLKRHYGPDSPQPLPGAEIARALKRSVRSVREAAERLGLTARKQKLDGREVRRLYDAGLSDYEIAARMGRNRSTVWGWRKKRNLPPHGRHRGHTA